VGPERSAVSGWGRPKPGQERGASFFSTGLLVSTV